MLAVPAALHVLPIAKPHAAGGRQQCCQRRALQVCTVCDKRHELTLWPIRVVHAMRVVSRLSSSGDPFAPAARRGRWFTANSGYREFSRPSMAVALGR